MSAEYPWARAAHTSLRPFCICFADHFLVDLGRAATTTLPLRLVLRRGQSDLGEAGEHRDLCLGVAQRIGLGQPPASAVPRGIFRQTQRWYTTNDVRWARVSIGSVPGRCTPGWARKVGGAEPIGECVDGLDEPVCNVAAAPRLGDVEVLQVAGQVRGSGRGMEDQVRQPGQLIFLFGDESVHRRGRVAQRRPGALGDFRREHGLSTRSRKPRRRRTSPWSARRPPPTSASGPPPCNRPRSPDV